RLRRIDPSSYPWLSKCGFLIRRRRQLPGTGRRRPHFGVDVDVEHAGTLVLDRLAQRACQIFALGNGEAVGAASARPRGEVRVVGLLVFLKISTKLPVAEHSDLDIPDRRPAEVVP